MFIILMSLGGLAFEKGWFTLNDLVLLYMSSYNNQRDQKNSDGDTNLLGNHQNSTHDVDDFCFTQHDLHPLDKLYSYAYG